MNCKVKKISKGSLNSISSPSVKIQIMGGKVCLWCKGKKLLGVVNNFLKTNSLLTSPSNVLPVNNLNVFVIVSEQFYCRNNNINNFVSKCSKFLANLCKSLEILEQCHVKWWLKYWNNRSVSWRLSCTEVNTEHEGQTWVWYHS